MSDPVPQSIDENKNEILFPRCCDKYILPTKITWNAECGDEQKSYFQRNHFNA